MARTHTNCNMGIVQSKERNSTEQLECMSKEICRKLQGGRIVFTDLNLVYKTLD